jgi:hypothetical protein
VRDALLLADASPRSSDPVLRLSRLLADLGFRAGTTAVGSGLLDVCETIGSELALVDGDISDRYFGGVAPAERLMTA